MKDMDTIIEFERPVRVSYLALNTIPFEHTPDTTIEKAERRVGDDPKDDPDDVAHVGGEEYLKVSVDAKCLVVETTDASEVYGKPHFETCVKRVEDRSGIERLRINPQWDIREINPSLKKTERDAILNHRATVEQILSGYVANNPSIVYDGPMLLEARFAQR